MSRTPQSSNPDVSAADANSPRQRRSDGDVTRTGIIEVAGCLFAGRGYIGATGKTICEHAGVNISAINYHFGNRDGLYVAVLKEAHHRFMSLESLRELSTSHLPANEKLHQFFDRLVHRLLEGESWPMQVWARELLTPTPFLERVLHEDTQPKFELLATIITGITAIPANDPRMTRLVLSVIAPCLVMLIVDRHTATPIQPLFSQPPSEVANGLWQFAMAGLSHVAA